MKIFLFMAFLREIIVFIVSERLILTYDAYSKSQIVCSRPFAVRICGVIPHRKAIFNAVVHQIAERSLELRGGGPRSNIHRRSKRKPKGVDRMRKSRRIHGLIRPHDAKHEAERRSRYFTEETDLNETAAGGINEEAHSEDEKPRIKKEKPLRLGERRISQIMNSIYAFKKENPEVFEEERRIMIDNEAYLMVLSILLALAPVPVLKRRGRCSRRSSSGKTPPGSPRTRRGRRRGRSSTTRTCVSSAPTATTISATATTPATPSPAGPTPRRRTDSGGRRGSWGMRRRRAAWATAS